MSRLRCVWLASFALGCTLRPSGAESESEPHEDPARAPPSALERSLAFEVEHPDDTPAGWDGGPEGTWFVDAEVVHDGRWAARIERSATSNEDFSVVMRSLPIDFGGEVLELRAWMRTEGVEGHAGLWLREDGPTGPVQFDNMGGRAVSGTTAWTPYTIELPLDDDARELFLGALLAGTGKVWVDDFELLVDGVPVERAPPATRRLTILDTDTEFEAGAGVELEGPASPAQLDSLVVLAKVWGFLKYHHPRATGGDKQWDFELFRVLPAVLAAGDASQRNAALVAWIEGLGELPPCQECPQPATKVQLEPRIDWIHDAARLGPELVAVLEHVHRNRASAEQFWVDQYEGIGNADFSREPAYAKLEAVDLGYRLLAAFRLWTIIEYWFPYRDQIEESWDGVLAELLPAFIAASERAAYERALLALVARAHDTHANIWSALDSRPPLGACGLAADFRFVGGEAVVVRVHPDAGLDLEPGDVLVEIEGQALADLVETWTPLYAASNPAARDRDMARNLSRGACGPVEVALERGPRREAHAVTLERTAGWSEHLAMTHDRPGPALQMLGPDVAYLKLSTLVAEDIRGHVEAVADKEGLILDLRNYPNTFAVFELGQHLVDEPTTFACFTEPELDNPGAFVWGPCAELEPRKPRVGGKILILVDEVSQSSSEYHAMAFEAAPGAVVIGSTTAGADGNVSSFALPGAERSMISGIGVFYPDKTPTQRVGIVPDIEVRPTREGIAAGRDEVLERALVEVLGPGRAAKLIADGP